jgi:RimJ/RimL family protein N-acetyltransferase
MENDNVMEISKYGVMLRKLILDKIELVRNWRNDPKISKYMEFRDYITPEMQKKWFEKINNNFNYYFIVIYNQEEIGLVNIKDIDFSSKCGEPGIFIYNDKYLTTDVGFRSALCNMDFAFETLKLDYLSGHIMAGNKRALRFNKAFGYILADGEESKEKQRYILAKERYFECRKKLIAMLR